MASHTSVKTNVGKITKTGGYFSGAQLAKNIRSFMQNIKKA